jgi:tRNA nucleotidyltransferase (CCA-adding enzyme)
MKVYEVGGAIRDELLGLSVHDHDWVVVGATPQAMLEAGFRAVGRDFPVFLHPDTHEEYALARTERKVAPGHIGFAIHAAPTVTLEEDLRRRDLTINAMARDTNGRIIDPHGGRHDLQAGVLRHVSEAFEEDPVRILRLARFAARLPTFTVAPETMALMRRMVASGEIDALVPERCWQELSRGLMTGQPSRMFEVLRACGALARLLPELDQLWGIPQPAHHHPEIDAGLHVMRVIDYCAARGLPLPVRFATLLHDLGQGTPPTDALPRHNGHEQHSVAMARVLCARLRVPNELRDLALIVAAEHSFVHRIAEARAPAVLQLLERCDALRKPARFQALLLACEADARGRLDLADRPYPQADRLFTALAAARSVDAGRIASETSGEPLPATGGQTLADRIPARVQAARLAAVETTLTALDARASESPAEMPPAG